MTAEPLPTTFEALAASGRPEADEALIAALEVPQPAIRELAASVILRRGSIRGLLELLRRFEGLSDETRRLLSEPSDSLSQAFRQGLKHGDEPLVLPVLAAARAGGHVDQLPNVIPLLRSESGTLRNEAAETLWALADRLHNLLSQGGARIGRTDPHRLREETLEGLAAACDHFDMLPEPNRVIEPLLALGTPRHPAVVKVLRQSAPECRQFAAETLATSRHPGVMRLLFDFLGETYPPRRIFETLRTRDDPEFVAALLRWLPKSPSATQTANLKQIEAVSWLEEPERIADLPEGLQGQVSSFVLATGLPEPRKTEIQEWLVRNASAEGRRGAAQVFDRLDFETTKRILLDSLDSRDEDVSAWATSQLRTRHVPGAFRLLVDRLDSGSTTVQKAARDELRGFTIEHLIAISDRLTPTLCRQAGRLVRKIDPDCVAKLAAMIGSPFQRQRIAAAQSVVRLGMVEELRDALLGLLEDEDNMIRRIGVEILAEDPTPEVIAAIRELASDPSPRVRQAVERALAGKQPAMTASAT